MRTKLQTMSSETKTFLLLILVISSNSVSSLLVSDLPPVPEDGGKLWVVLAAGSNSWYNYRHQADVCHAYQIVHGHGIPDEQIIVLMYDDIANNEMNPTPGVIINRPNGTDVYKGVPRDYTKEFANNETFVKVLLGEDLPFGSGKTLKSDANDHVFVYFSDHGAKGIVAFGDNYLTAKTLNDAISKMHADKKFKKLVFYLEACESGSMFKNLLPDNIDVYATTASNGSTSSYACYYDNDRKTFLGDVYSIKWLEDSDNENLSQETLDHQYDLVKWETNTSTVCRFGDLTMGALKVADFQGNKDVARNYGVKYFTEGHYNDNNNEDGDVMEFVEIKSLDEGVDPSWFSCGRDAVPSHEVPRVILEKSIESANSEEEKESLKKKLQSLLNNRRFLSDVTRQVVDLVTSNEAETAHVYGSNHEIENYDCYYAAVDAYHTTCFNLGCNDFALRQVNIFANMCQMGYNANHLVAAIKKVCKHQLFCGIY